MQHSIEVATESRDAHLSVAWRRGTSSPRSCPSKCRGEVHFDELARESEPADPQQCACGRECRSDDGECEPLPGGRENGTVVADYIDHGPDDVVCLRADRS